MNSIHSGRGWPRTCLKSGGGLSGLADAAALLMHFSLDQDEKSGRASPTGRGASNGRDWCVAACALSSAADYGAHVQQFGKEGEFEGLLEEGHAGRPAGTALVPDDAFHRLHVAEPPQLEGFLDIHQLFAEVVLGPELVGVLVDALEYRHQVGAIAMRLR